MNSEGAVAFLKAGLERTLKETTASHTATVQTAWLEPFTRVLLQDSTQIQINESLTDTLLYLLLYAAPVFNIPKPVWE